MEELVPIFVAEELLLLVPRQISYDVAPTTADHVTVTLAVDVPSVALAFTGAFTMTNPQIASAAKSLVPYEATDFTQ